MDLRMRVRVQGNAQSEATILEIGGEMDLHSAPQLRASLAELTAAPLPRIVIDLSDVTFVDSTGVGALVGALRRAREAGGKLHFCGLQQRVRRVFEITGLIGALPIFDSRQAAIDAFEASQSSQPDSDKSSSQESGLDEEAAHDG